MNIELKTYKSYDDYLNYLYYQHFLTFWIPILRKQVILAKLTNDIDALLEIKENIYHNEKLNDYRLLIIEMLGIKYLHPRK